MESLPPGTWLEQAAKILLFMTSASVERICGTPPVDQRKREKRSSLIGKKDFTGRWWRLNPRSRIPAWPRSSEAAVPSSSCPGRPRTGRPPGPSCASRPRVENGTNGIKMRARTYSKFVHIGISVKAFRIPLAGTPKGLHPGNKELYIYQGW